jgi:hypothetical protein
MADALEEEFQKQQQKQQVLEASFGEDALEAEFRKQRQSQGSFSGASLGGDTTPKTAASSEPNSSGGDDPFGELSFERGSGANDHNASGDGSPSDTAAPAQGESYAASKARQATEAATAKPVQAPTRSKGKKGAKAAVAAPPAGADPKARNAKGETYAEYKARQDTESAEAELWEAAADQAAAQAEAQDRLKDSLKQDRAATVLQNVQRRKGAKVALAAKRSEKTALRAAGGADAPAAALLMVEAGVGAGVALDDDDDDEDDAASDEAVGGGETKAREDSSSSSSSSRRPELPPPSPASPASPGGAGEKKHRAHALARKPSRRFTPEPQLETTVQLCRRLVATRASGLPLFEGMLPKKRVELSRYYKSAWKGRFLKVYFDRIEYGKWNKWGRLVLRRGSPLAVNHSFSVFAEGGSGTDAPTPSSPPGPRFLVVRAQRADKGRAGTGTPSAQAATTHVFLDDPGDKKKKGKACLAVLADLQRCQTRLFMERTVHKYLGDAVQREHRRDLKKWSREAKPLLLDGGVEGLLTPGLPELLVQAVELVETIYAAQEAWRAKLEDILERLLADTVPGVGDGQTLAMFGAAHRLATEGVEMNGDVVSKSCRCLEQALLAYLES